MSYVWDWDLAGQEYRGQGVGLDGFARWRELFGGVGRAGPHGVYVIKCT